MAEPLKSNPLSSRVIETKPAAWKEFHFIQLDTFKNLPIAAAKKLKQSILANEFTQPFYVWLDESAGVTYCLDGRHRTLMLEELEEEGVDVPELLPATFIRCADKADAAKLVLTYSSIYAKVTEEGLFEFMNMYELDPEQMSAITDLPGFTFPEIPTIKEDPFDDAGIGVKNQYGVIIMCDNEEDQKEKFEMLTGQGMNCKIVVT